MVSWTTWGKVALWTGVLIACISDVTMDGNTTASYTGYKAHLIQPSTKSHVKALKKLSKVPGVDFWSPPSKRSPVTAMVAPGAYEMFQKLLTKHSVPFDLTIPDVAEIIQREQMLQQEMSNRKASGKAYLTRYLRYDEVNNLLVIVSVMQNLTDAYPKQARMEKIGKSFEGRDMYMMKLSRSDSRDEKRPVAMMIAGIHAREWAAPALAMHIMHQVLERPELLSEMDWHVIPSANPDGYEYSHTKDRLWRKTRSKVLKNGGCIGADANRNFAVHWAEIGSSSDPCDEIYHGVKAFSEAESRNIADAAAKYKKRIKTYVDLHSFGNFILYPYGHTRTLVPEWRSLDKCGRSAARAIQASGGPKFTVGNTATVLYPSGGGSDDYMKFKFRVPYAFTVELPGGGRSGFDLPQSHIKEMVQQVFPGIETLASCWKSK